MKSPNLAYHDNASCVGTAGRPVLRRYSFCDDHPGASKMLEGKHPQKNGEKKCRKSSTLMGCEMSALVGAEKKNSHRASEYADVGGICPPREQ